MKKIVCVVLLISCVICGLVNFSNLINNYEKECKVISVTGEYVECIDNHGDVWAFTDDTKDYDKDDIIILNMSTNGTDTIIDDEIVGIK